MSLVLSCVSIAIVKGVTCTAYNSVAFFPGSSPAVCHILYRKRGESLDDLITCAMMYYVWLYAYQAKCSKTVCMRDNSITQTTHKTMHSTSLHMRSNLPGSLPAFCAVCNIKLGRTLGMRLLHACNQGFVVVGIIYMCKLFESLHATIYYVECFTCFTALCIVPAGIQQQ